MTDLLKIKSFVRNLSSIDAWSSVQLNAVNKKGSSLLPVLEREEILFYPYLHFLFVLKLRRFRGVKEAGALCCISMTDGREAMITKLPPRERIEVIPVQLLPVELTRDEAEKKARRYLLHPLLKKEKILNPPTLKLKDEEFCYRPFYHFTARIEGKEPFGVLVDALTGRYQTIDYYTSL